MVLVLLGKNLLGDLTGTRCLGPEHSEQGFWVHGTVNM